MIHAELQLGLLAIIHGESLHQQGSKSRPSSTTETMEDEESLEPGAVVSQLPDAVQHQVYDLLTDSVVTSGVVISSILFSRDHLLRMEELSVGSSADLVNNCRLQVEENGSGHMFTVPGLGEEGGEAVVRGTLSRIRRKLSIRLDTVLHTVELPAGIAHLYSRLTHMDRDAFPHGVLGR